MRYRRLLASLCVLSICMLTVRADASACAAEASSDWVRDFFAAYDLEDGRHLAYYSDDIVLVDETAGQTLTGKDQVRAVFEAAKENYSNITWMIEDEIIGENRVVVRGRSSGQLLDKPYDIAFTTWFEVKDGKIVRQVDYVDYAALMRQVQSPQ